ncbi:hypothetical protein B0H19DRAFT_1059895 [Mycena capillaripes]|nr:hypothetical protein B0H19DRAFT_1059895 [Mycena capillaripes]
MASILAISGVCRPDSATSARTAWLALRTVPTSLPSQHLLADGQPHRSLAESGRGNITTSAYLHDEASQLEVSSRKFGSQARFIDVQTPTEVFATAINECVCAMCVGTITNADFTVGARDWCNRAGCRTISTPSSSSITVGRERKSRDEERSVVL